MSRSRVLTVAAAALSLLALSDGPATGTASAAVDPSCPDVEVVFARGTFEAPGVGDTGQAFVDALTARLPGRNVVAYPVDYPASLDFQAAADGVEDASAKVEAIAAECPATEIVVGGYSQGAAVAGYITADAVPEGFTLPAGIRGPMPPAVAPHVAAVILFGTPDNWFLNLVDRDAPPLTIGSLYSAKTLELCAPGDPVCFPGGLDRSAHSGYKSNGMADQAADFTVNALARNPLTQSA
ncbi:cutinase family protein [Mycobacterium sp. ACS4331]|uniref:cutinase family protein n=1 Tax=Mycobacterium sp. ACS4331 TaxID=1834121 RepID=UPI0007FEF71F|nr:cutinase family protein [Mycobacterium sp. ACS4331]OBF11403.1 cutinase [Mycobacterium sp. ACS4331]